VACRERNDLVNHVTHCLTIAALALGSAGAAAAQDPLARGSVDQIGSPQPVGMQQVERTATSRNAAAAPEPQLSSVVESVTPSLQLTRERGSGAASPQLTRGPRTAQPSQALSTPAEGRTGSVERVAGSDRCDPAATDRARPAKCAAVIETRAAEYTRREPAPLSPEQRIIVEQQARERSGSFSSAARRLAANGDDARSIEAQGVASLVLGAPPVEPKRERPAEDPAATEQLNAIVNAIINQPAPQ
jgi:hypothetical protein